jgi:hypothetical protein
MLMLIPALLSFLLIGWILDKIIIRTEDPAAIEAPSKPEIQHTPPQRVDSMRLGLAIVAGIVLASLLGLAYGLFFASFRPRLISSWISRPMVLGLFVLVVGLVVLGIILVRRFMSCTQTYMRYQAAQGICLGVLVCALSGLTYIVSSTQAVLIKKPVQMRQSLVNIPQTLGRWEMIQDERLPAEVLQELRTKYYISRQYRDTKMMITDPGSTIRLHVAYYTGTPDTVPHVPERCFVAAGLSPRGKEVTTVHLATSHFEMASDGTFLGKSRLSPTPVRIPRLDIPATIFTYGSSEKAVADANVIYFFAANGKFLPTPDHVRFQGFSLTDEYSYYCKIEVGINLVGDKELARQRASDFLSDFLPQVMACLPDWVDVTEGRWPPNDEPAP